MDWKTVLILLGVICVAASLECFSCKDVSDVSECSSTQRCSDGQACFHNSTTLGGIVKIDLGCMAYQRCGAHGTVQGSIVGREINTRQTSSCLECCNSDQCNTHLCEHLKPTVCVDDESIDCPKLNSLFNICVDIDHAKKVCPRFCGLCNVVDGNWSEWASWSQCDVSCENGTMARSRSCTNPSPQHGGLDCQGDRTATKLCVKELCPVHGGWSIWEDWMACSSTCGSGLQNRARNCSNPLPLRNGRPCLGHSIDVKQCMLTPCQDGGWNDWGSWSACSVTCDVGVRSQSRSCSNPFPSPYGRYCQGENIKVETCGRNNCEQNHCSPDPCEKGQCIDTPHDYTCICSPGFGGRNCNKHETDCYDVLHNNVGKISGIYRVKPRGSLRDFDVFCDLETSGGGWTVFQQRFNGSVDFYRNFKNYTQGFGSLDGEFWLGLENIYEMLSQGSSELRIDLMAADGSKAYEIYQNFYLSPGQDYTLHIGTASGTAGDSWHGLSFHNGYNFYTYDHDNRYACASTQIGHGGWWYRNCGYVNLNGEYVTPGTERQIYAQGGIIYYAFQHWESLKRSKMMFRRTRN